MSFVRFYFKGGKLLLIHATTDTGCVCPSILSEPTGMKSFLKTELQLTLGGTKEPQQNPPPLLSCVLQALAIQGELQHKIKLFSKTQCPVNFYFFL